MIKNIHEMAITCFTASASILAVLCQQNSYNVLLLKVSASHEADGFVKNYQEKF